MSKDWVADIAEMHKKFGVHGVDGFPGATLTGKFLRFRQRFLEEELQELEEGIEEKNPEKVVDALVDICVVAIGTLDIGKVNSYHAWDRVLSANLTKIPGPNPARLGSGGFDLIKPEGWEPPSHAGNTGYFGIAINEIHKNKIGISEKMKVPSHIKTLHSYIDHALDKTHDYDDEHDPEFFHFNYYPEGIRNIIYELEKKVKRIKHGLNRIWKTGTQPKTDSLHDSFRDISIYSAIGDTIIKGELEGQISTKDMFNREISG